MLDSFSSFSETLAHLQSPPELDLPHPNAYLELDLVLSGNCVGFLIIITYHQLQTQEEIDKHTCFSQILIKS